MSKRRRKNIEESEGRKIKDTIENQKKKVDMAFENIKNIFNKKEKEEKQEEKKINRKEKIQALKYNFFSKYNAINKYKFVAVTLTIILGIVAIYFVTNYHLFGLSLIKDLSTDDAIIYTTMNSDSIIREYGEYILVIEKDSMIAINRYGKEVWKKTLNESFIPHICISGNYIQLTNMDTGRIYVYNSKYEIARIEVGAKINSAYINEDGISVIEYREQGAKTTMSVYNKQGKELKKVNLDKDSIINISLNGNRYLAYTYLDLSGITVITVCDIIDLKTEEIYNIWTENNQILCDIFWDGNKLYSRLNDTILLYDVVKNKLDRYDTYDLNPSFIDVDGDRIAILSTAQNFGYNLSLQKYGDSLKFLKHFEQTPIDFEYNGSLAYICTKKDIYVYSKYGINAKNINLDISISDWITFNYGKSICVISGNQLLIFNI